MRGGWAPGFGIIPLKGPLTGYLQVSVCLSIHLSLYLSMHLTALAASSLVALRRLRFRPWRPRRHCRTEHCRKAAGKAGRRPAARLVRRLRPHGRGRSKRYRLSVCLSVNPSISVPLSIYLSKRTERKGGWLRSLSTSSSSMRCVRVSFWLITIRRSWFNVFFSSSACFNCACR